MKKIVMLGLLLMVAVMGFGQATVYPDAGVYESGDYMQDMFTGQIIELEDTIYLTVDTENKTVRWVEGDHTDETLSFTRKEGFYIFEDEWGLYGITMEYEFGVYQHILSIMTQGMLIEIEMFLVQVE